MYMPPNYAIHYNILSRYYFAFVVMVITCGVVTLLANSKLGLAFVALGDDDDAARVTGVNTFKYKVYAMILSALFAGLAGGVYAYFRISMVPFYAFVLLRSFEPLVATAIGGMGTMIGPVIGSFILVILSDIFSLTLGEAHLIIFGVLLIFVVLYFPYGIVVSFYRIWMLFGRLAANKRPAEG